MLRSLSHQLAGPSGSSLSRLAAAAATEASPSASCEGFLPAVFTSLVAKRWATKKQGGSTRNSKDSHPKHLGAKMMGGQLIFPGQIIVRQRGTKFFAGQNVGIGKDHTLFSKAVGFIQFRRQTMLLPERLPQHRRYVDVLPVGNDWGQQQVERMAEMVAARQQIKQRLLGPRLAAAR